MSIDALAPQNLLPGIAVRGEANTRGQPVAEYRGSMIDLVAAGIIPAEWVEPSGKHRKTPQGFKCSIARSWRQCGEGELPERYAVVRILVPDFSHLDCLPASSIVRSKAEEYWRRLDAALRSDRKHRESLNPHEKQPPRRSHLRLVVDND